MKFRLAGVVCVALMMVCGLCSSGQAAADTRPSEVVKKTTWNGYDRLDFRVDGRDCLLVLPKAAAPGKPWIWRTEFFGHEPQGDLGLLANGFHVAYINVQNLYGGPPAMVYMDAFYAHLVQEYGLSRKTVLEGLSRGGLFAYNWAARNPEKVASIYVDAPVCDFKSWPGGKGKSKGSAADWQRCLQVYGLTEEQAMQYKLNPVDNLAPLAKAGIPILSVCGLADDVVPFEENTGLVEKRYKELGGSITVITKPFCGHHPHSLRQPTPIVNFVLSHTPGMTAPGEIRTPNTPYGYDYFVLRGGLDNCRLKFEREKTGRVVFLGGSITAGKGWRDLVCQELQRRFPQTQFDFINAGISSMGSTPGAFRFSRDVLKDGPVDLLFEEAAVNDETNGQTDLEEVRGMEGIVRQARLSSPAMDIVLLHFVEPEMMAVIRQGKRPTVIVNHEKVADYYGLPSIDLAQEVTERIEAKEFTWEKDFKGLHPAPFGHELYAKSIARLFDAAWKQPLAADAQIRPYELPKPLDPKSYFRGRLVDIKQATLVSGWKIEDNWRPTEKIGTRAGFVNVPMLVAEEAGATLKLKFKGTAVGIFIASGPDAGTVEHSIDGGAMKKRDLYTQWSSQLHLPWAQVLSGDLADGEHELELRVSESANEKSKGHAVRIVYFLAN